MYSRAVRVLRALFRLEGWRAQGTPAPAPAVYVVHHQNMAGPIRFADGVPFARQKAQVALRLRQAITALCTQPEFPPQEKQNS